MRVNFLYDAGFLLSRRHAPLENHEALPNIPRRAVLKLAQVKYWVTMSCSKCTFSLTHMDLRPSVFKHDLYLKLMFCISLQCCLAQRT